jgi:small-conductance mechanosensitive channel
VSEPSGGAQRLGEKAAGLIDRPLFEIAGTSVTVATLATIGLTLVTTLLAAKLLSRLFGRLLRRRGKAGEGEVRALVRFVRYVIWMVGGTVALSTAGIDLTALAAAGAVFAVAIGFATQNVVQNFVAGVILLLERAIKPGDVLEVEGQMVKVMTMGIRTTVARTLDDEDLIVPNSTLVQSAVKNFTGRDNEYRLRARVGVAYDSDMNQVRDVLQRTAEGLSWRLPRFAPRILLVQFGSSSVDWEISVWIDDPWRVRGLHSELNLALWWALRQAGITIAFPQLDVHLYRAPVATGRPDPTAADGTREPATGDMRD